MSGSPSEMPHVRPASALVSADSDLAEVTDDLAEVTGDLGEVTADLAGTPVDQTGTPVDLAQAPDDLAEASDDPAEASGPGPVAGADDAAPADHLAEALGGLVAAQVERITALHRQLANRGVRPPEAPTSD